MLPPESRVPSDRVTAVNRVAVVPHRDFVLYWQIAARRTRWSYALDHAVAHARALGRPLVVLEALRVGYRWASDRLHRFAIDGMADDARRYAAAGVWHLPYVEPAPDEGKGLLETLAARACVVVTDEFPEFFLPRMVAAAGRRLRDVGARLESVDGCGLLPLRTAGKAHVYAHQFRRLVQHAVVEHLGWFPSPDPLAAARRLPRVQAGSELATWLDGVRARWPAASPALLAGKAGTLAALPIDHAVPPVAMRGGERAGTALLDDFLDARLARYAERRNEPAADAASGLSPYLHWGFVSPHQVFAALAEREGWSPTRVAPRPTGKREGWWGMSANAEAFLDELVTWRELAYNGAMYLDGHDTFDALPPWARDSLERHAADPRPRLFPLEELERAATGDALWNAAQTQLRTEGRIHNYLRMLWGKKALEWTAHPRDAFEILLHLNNRWALDGRDPNSVAGVAWVMGRYDRPWAPEKPIIGLVRPMSSANTARKYDVREYLRRYAPAASPGAQLDAFVSG